VIVDSYSRRCIVDDPGHGCSLTALGAGNRPREPRTRKAFAGQLEQMIDMLQRSFRNCRAKAARKQAMAAIRPWWARWCWPASPQWRSFPTKS